MASRNYRELFAWQRAMDLVELAYRLTRKFPKEELFSSQASFVALQFQFLPTSRKVKDAGVLLSSVGSFASHMDCFAKLKRS